MDPADVFILSFSPEFEKKMADLSSYMATMERHVPKINQSQEILAHGDQLLPRCLKLTSQAPQTTPTPANTTGSPSTAQSHPGQCGARAEAGQPQ